MRWVGNVACTGAITVAYIFCIGTREGKRAFGRPRRRWDDNVNKLWKVHVAEEFWSPRRSSTIDLWHQWRRKGVLTGWPAWSLHHGLCCCLWIPHAEIPRMQIPHAGTPHPVRSIQKRMCESSCSVQYYWPIAAKIEMRRQMLVKLAATGFVKLHPAGLDLFTCAQTDK
jgi:hypothetical protein